MQNGHDMEFPPASTEVAAPRSRRVSPRGAVILTGIQAGLGFLVALFSLVVGLSSSTARMESFSLAALLAGAGIVLAVACTRQQREIAGERSGASGLAGFSSVSGHDVMVVLAGGLVASNFLSALVVLTVVLGTGGANPSAATTTVASFLGQLAAYIGMGANIYVYCLDRRGLSLRDIGWGRPRTWSWLLAAPVFAVAAYVVGGVFQQVSERLLPNMANGQCINVRSAFQGPLAFLFAFPVVCIVAPLVEETLFRGLLYGVLSRFAGVALGILMSAVIFSAFHLVLVLFLPLMAVGAILAWTYAASKSLWMSALVHGLFNLVGLYALLYLTTSC